MSSNISNKLLLWVLLTAVCLPAAPVYSQELPKIIPPSPSTQQFMKYVDYPVGSFTGVPDISIPLYTVKEGDLTVPITLNYHASGTKPADLKGLVGLGWTLNSGGKISRTIMGQPDEVSPPNPFYSTAQLNYMLPSVRETYFHNIEQNNADTEPDLYNYNFFGHSGKFIIKKDGTYNPLMLPYAPLKIKQDIHGDFNVTDEKGIQYKLSSSESFSNAPYPTATTAWDISSVTSATDTTNIIHFATLGSQNETLLTRTDEFITDDHASSIETPWVCSEADNATATYMNYYPTPAPFSRLVNYVYNVAGGGSVTFRSGKVLFSQFTSGNFNGMVSKMEVFDYNQKLLQSVEFVYKLESNSKSLLKELDFYDSTHQLINTYKFDYFSENATIPLPATAGVDYWGYYTGTTISGNGNELLTNWHVSYDEPGRFGLDLNPSNSTSRVTNVDGMKTYVLNKITYPTGGYSVYDFEANQYSGISNYSGSDVGGLRVKSISHYKSAGATPEKKSYSYGTGIMDIEPGHVEDYAYSEEVALISWTQSSAGPYVLYRRRHYPSEPSFSLTPHGSPVVYQDVTEYDDGTVDNGAVSYHFDYEAPQRLTLSTNSTPWSSNDVLYRTHYLPLLDWHSGNLLSKTIGTGSRTIHKETNYYSNTAYPTDSARAFYMEPFVSYIADPCTAPPPGQGPYEYIANYVASAYNYNDYFYQREYHHLDSTSVADYDNAGLNPVVTTTKYQYANNIHDQVTQQTVTGSKGETIITQYKYPHDFISQTPYNVMVNNRHTWIPVIEQQNYKDVADAAHLLNATKTDYSIWNSQQSEIHPSLISTQIGALSSSYEPRIEFKSYNGLGSVTEIAKSSGTNISYLWGYQRSYPVAEAKNAPQELIAYTSFEEEIDEDLPDNPYNWDVASTRVSTDAKTGHYSCRIGGSPVVCTNEEIPAGIYKVSLWSKSGNPYVSGGSPFGGGGSVIATKQGITDSHGWTYREYTVQLTVTGIISVGSNATDNDFNVLVDELRLHPIDAQMTTYTYDPLVGITSVTDAKGELTYYEYDNYQRLINVRDEQGNVIKHSDYHYQIP